MITDTALKSLKPRDKAYKVTDGGGMHAFITTKGNISFRYDYRINGRRETLTIGRYDRRAGQPTRNHNELDYGMSVTLAEARILLSKARSCVERGESPSRAKVEKRTAANEALTFDGWTQKYFSFKSDPKSGAKQLAESTLAIQKSTYKRVLLEKLGKLKMAEVTPQRLKALCDEVKTRRGPAVAIHAREIVLAVFRYAQDSGLTVSNPAETVRASSIATFAPRDRALSPDEIKKFFTVIEQVATTATLRLALKFVLLTGVRKGEFIDATWKEIDFETERWIIPAERMKAGTAHIVYLSDQALDILTTLKACYGASRYLHPGRYDSDLPISNATLNRLIDITVQRIKKDDPDFQTFSVHDLRRTFSTSLNKAKFDERWIEMSLAHKPKNTIAATYNVARYANERRIMMQCWADMLDCWIKGASAREVITNAKRRAAEVLDLDIDEDL